jgi:hypothetical protein
MTKPRNSHENVDGIFIKIFGEKNAKSHRGLVEIPLVSMQSHFCFENVTNPAADLSRLPPKA